MFHLSLANGSSETIPLSSLAPSQFSASASSREKFKVIEVVAGKEQLAAGETTDIEVITDGSPKWFGIKYLSIKVDAGAFGNGAEQVLSINFDEVERRTVDVF